VVEVQGFQSLMGGIIFLGYGVLRLQWRSSDLGRFGVRSHARTTLPRAGLLHACLRIPAFTYSWLCGDLPSGENCQR
jgi:hypothetical protein